MTRADEPPPHPYTPVHDSNACLTSPFFLPCIVGPTGVGKTAVALALAKEFPISVINADSRQIYADFPLLTAQPSPKERRACPHLLYGFLPADQKLGAGAYARMATEAIEQEKQRQRLPMLVGGTGLYVKALLQGMAPIPPAPPAISVRWRQRCQTEGCRALHCLLATSDPEYAAKIHPHDRQRITRALEVLDATGHTVSWWHRQPLPAPAYRPCKLGITMPLAQLKSVLQRRVDAILEAGALEEARAALARFPNSDAPGWSGIGCMEIYHYLTGTLSFDECRDIWVKNTRAYAKRQLTWFRADPTIRWFLPWQIQDMVAYVRAEKDKGA